MWEHSVSRFAGEGGEQSKNLTTTSLPLYTLSGLQFATVSERHTSNLQIPVLFYLNYCSKQEAWWAAVCVGEGGSRLSLVINFSGSFLATVRSQFAGDTRAVTLLFNWWEHSVIPFSGEGRGGLLFFLPLRGFHLRPSEVSTRRHTSNSKFCFVYLNYCSKQEAWWEHSMLSFCGRRRGAVKNLTTLFSPLYTLSGLQFATVSRRHTRVISKFLFCVP